MRAVLLLLALLATVRADWTITNKVEGGMAANNVVLRLKGDKARIDVNPSLSVLTDLGTGDSITLNHTTHVMLKIPAAAAAQIRQSAIEQKEGAKLTPPALKETGKKEKIGAHECGIYTWSLGDIQVTDWIAPNFPNFRPILEALQRFQNSGLASSATPLMPPLEQFPGMVIKREILARGMKSTTTLVSAKEGPIDPKLFVPPADYKEQPPLELPGSKP